MKLLKLRSWVAERAARRAAIKDMKRLTVLCTERLVAAAMPRDLRQTIKYSHWEASLEVVADAYTVRDHDLLKVCERFLNMELLYLKDIVMAVRALGHENTFEVMTKDFVSESLALGMIMTSPYHDTPDALSFLSVDDTRLLLSKATSLLFLNPGTSEIIRHLIIDRGIVDDEQLEDMLSEMLQIPSALLDGTL